MSNIALILYLCFREIRKRWLLLDCLGKVKRRMCLLESTRRVKERRVREKKTE